MEYPCEKGKPSFDAKNKVGTVPAGKKKNPALDMSLFSKDALSGEIPANGKYAKKGKGAMVNKSVATSKSNVISPTSDY